MNGELDIFKIILDSGIVVKLVMLSLIIFSVISWAIILKKKKTFKQLLQNNDNFLRLYRESSSLKEVMSKKDELESSPCKTMFIHGYSEFGKMKDSMGKDDKKRMQDHFCRFGMGLISRALQKGVKETSLELNEGLSILASIGSITPFIGLFGTVWGIIDSFAGLASGGGSLEAVAPGIAEALVATAMGLFAAIPAMWFYNNYLERNDTIYSRMEVFEKEFINSIERSLI